MYIDLDVVLLRLDDERVVGITGDKPRYHSLSGFPLALRFFVVEWTAWVLELENGLDAAIIERRTFGNCLAGR